MEDQLSSKEGMEIKSNQEDNNSPLVEEEQNVGSGTSEIEPQVLPDIKYEYLDHTADVQIHAWGNTLQEAFEQCAMGMFGYMTDIETVDNLGHVEIEANGDDMEGLLYRFLDEFLYVFSAEPYFICRKVVVQEFDPVSFRIKAAGYGEEFDLTKHPQGAEVKAITYSNMQIHQNETFSEIYVIIDI